MIRRFLYLISVVLLAVLLLCSCAKEEAPPSPSPTPEESAAPAEPSPSPDATLSALDEIRVLMNDGHYYEAFREMLAFEESTQDEDAHAACEALFAELEQLLHEIEPETGTELERGFTVQGGGILEVYAFNGPALVTVTDAEADTQPDQAANYVRFYVRQGERGETHVPGGTYRVRYQVGYRWFGEEGFGDYCTEGELPEPLVFDFYMDGQWANNAKFSITL